MEIKTLKSQQDKNIDYACKLCNDIARLNGAPKDVFEANPPNIIELASNRYANKRITKGIYATLFVIDSSDTQYGTAYYTQIGYECPIQITINNIDDFIKDLEST